MSLSLCMQLFLRGGYSVMLYDVISEQLGGAMSAVVEKLRVMEKEGLLREGKQSSRVAVYFLHSCILTMPSMCMQLCTVVN